MRPVLIRRNWMKKVIRLPLKGRPMTANVDVIVREVGLRDGLQLAAGFFPTGEKLAWITAPLRVPVCRKTTYRPLTGLDRP